MNEYEIMQGEIHRLHKVCRKKNKEIEQVLKQIESMTRNTHSCPPVAKLQMINKICNDALEQK